MLFRLLRPLIALSCVLATSAAGDGDGEPPPGVVMPPAPVVPLDQAAATFALPPGLHIELAVGEPLVNEPVAIAFDPDGRLWVAEMNGYMPNITGEGEAQPTGTIAVLEDTDGDGRFDKRTVFLDQLVLPRALAFAAGGLLVAEPPKLWFCTDKDGDLRCDDKVAVGNYGSRANVEHTANGLLYGLDNCYWSANHGVRYRRNGDQWIEEKTVSRGQWGITQDDVGRLFYNNNSDFLRGDLVPGIHLSRDGKPTALIGSQLCSQQTVWPSRPNTGVNRGYQAGTLRPDGTLSRCTAACGPGIYRGDLLPAEFRGNAFVCEPSANLVRRFTLKEAAGRLQAENPYPKGEFLTSTDERFRPVGAVTGPDGALYIVDLYHGILQHRIYLTTYLKRQIGMRGLDKPERGMGRIWRVAPTGAARPAKPALGKADTATLIAALSHDNGWWRDTAQRLLIERKDAATTPALRLLAANATAKPLARLHALYALSGLGGLDQPTVLSALGDGDARVRATAVRLAGALTGGPGKAELLARLATMTADSDALVQLQLAALLGTIPEAKPALDALLAKFGANPLIGFAAKGGGGGTTTSAVNND